MLGSDIKNSSNDKNFAPGAVRIYTFRVHGIINSHIIALHYKLVKLLMQSNPPAYSRVHIPYMAYDFREQHTLSYFLWSTDPKVSLAHEYCAKLAPPNVAQQISQSLLFLATRRLKGSVYPYLHL